MPEIFRQFGFSFFFYSDDHEPIHVHVEKGESEAIYEVSEDEISLRNNFGMKNNELRKIEELINENRNLIIDFWTKYFLYKT
ncbi:MAG: DUF4160 domain-containing protein [Chitinophagaceae bacterium]|jgi:hypothetical protein|nr:DUF4160 domain-containing protein [Chitinophagaceae bacterium]